MTANTSKNLKLFAVFLGGKAPGATIEVHDIVFVVGSKIQETFPQLIKKWFGDPQSVHVDSYIELTTIGPHKISLTKQKKNKGSLTLYFVNIGHCLAQVFGEQHQYHFLVNKSLTEAKKTSKQLFSLTPLSAHIDNLTEVEQLIPISQVDNYTIEFSPTNSPSQELIVHHVYWPLK